MPCFGQRAWHVGGVDHRSSDCSSASSGSSSFFGALSSSRSECVTVERWASLSLTEFFPNFECTACRFQRRMTASGAYQNVYPQLLAQGSRCSDRCQLDYVRPTSMNEVVAASKVADTSLSLRCLRCSGRADRCVIDARTLALGERITRVVTVRKRRFFRTSNHTETSVTTTVAFASVIRFAAYSTCMQCESSVRSGGSITCGRGSFALLQGAQQQLALMGSELLVNPQLTAAEARLEELAVFRSSSKCESDVEAIVNPLLSQITIPENASSLPDFWAAPSPAVVFVVPSRCCGERSATICCATRIRRQSFHLQGCSRCCA